MAAPYNPLSSPMPSKATIIARAKRRAQRDTDAKVAALPSDEILRQSNKSLLDSIAHNTGDFRSLAAGMGGSYGAAVQGANASDSSAGAQLGFTGTPGYDGRGGLLGALAGSTYGSLLGQQQAAAASLTGILQANAGKRAALQAGMPALYEQYLQQGYDDALKLAAARSNAALASGGQEIDAANAESRRISANASASRAETAARKALNDAKRANTDPAVQRALDTAFKQVQDMLKGKGTTKKTVAGNYHFKITDPNTGESLPFDVRAKNGTEARSQAQSRAASWLRDHGLSWQASYFTGMDPITQDVPNAGASRDAALHAAAAYLETVGGLTHAQALAYARSFLPPKPKKKKAKKPVDHVGGPH